MARQTASARLVQDVAAWQARQDAKAAALVVSAMVRIADEGTFGKLTLAPITAGNFAGHGFAASVSFFDTDSGAQLRRVEAVGITASAAMVRLANEMQRTAAQHAASQRAS